MQLVKEYEAVDVSVWLADCNAGVRAMLVRGDFAARCGARAHHSASIGASGEEINLDATALVFPTLSDALLAFLQLKAHGNCEASCRKHYQVT